MVRRRGTYARRARSYGRGLMGGMQGKLMKVGVGAAGAIAAKVGGNFNPQFGPAAGLGVVGFLANNDTLLTLSGMSLAQSLPIPGIGGSGNTGSGWY